MPFCPRSSVRSERHRAKVEVAGAIPAVDANLPLCLSSYRSGFVNRYSSVRVRPEAPFHGDHDVTAASRPVMAFVPVQIRLVTPISDFEPVRSESDSPSDSSCISWFNRGSNPHSAHNRSIGRKPGEIPQRFETARPARKRSPKSAQRTPNAFGVPAAGRWSSVSNF